jgi:hypothetical protein
MGLARARASDESAADRALRAIQRSTLLGCSLALNPCALRTKAAPAANANAKSEIAPNRNHPRRFIVS